MALMQRVIQLLAGGTGTAAVAEVVVEPKAVAFVA